MDFGKIFKRTWDITWNYKILWLFGLLASCGTNRSSSNFNSSFNYSTDIPDQLPPEFERSLFEMQRFFEQYGASIVSIAVIFAIIAIVLSLVFFLLRNFGKASLVRAALEIENNPDYTPTFQSVSQVGQEAMWPLLGLNFIYGMIVLLLIGGPLFIGFILGLRISSAFIFIFMCLICILMPIIFFSSIVVGMANYALLIENLKIMDAVKRGWQLLKENIGNLFISWLYLAFIRFGIGMVLLIPSMIVIVPIISMFVLGGPEAIMQNILYTFIGSLCLWPLFAFLNSMLQTYVNSLWTLVFIEIIGVESEHNFIEETSSI